MPEEPYRVAAIDIETEGPQAVARWLNEQAANGYRHSSTTPVPGKSTGFTLLIAELVGGAA